MSESTAHIQITTNILGQGKACISLISPDWSKLGERLDFEGILSRLSECQTADIHLHLQRQPTE